MPKKYTYKHGYIILGCLNETESIDPDTEANRSFRFQLENWSDRTLTKFMRKLENCFLMVVYSVNVQCFDGISSFTLTQNCVLKVKSNS